MQKDFSRRDFTRLTAAALGGVMAGATFGCNKEPGEVAQGDGDTAAENGEAASGEYDKSKHACRGLNECSGLGKSGDNECAGQGACATVSHSCAPNNDCKYQGGCGEEPGNNECAGQGGCHVPITMDDKWETARQLFEARMQAAGVTVGDAPPAG